MPGVMLSCHIWSFCQEEHDGGDSGFFFLTLGSTCGHSYVLISTTIHVVF